MVHSQWNSMTGGITGLPCRPGRGSLKNRDNAICSWAPWDSDLRKDALAMPSKNWKLQTRLLVREGVPHQQIHNRLKIIKERRRTIGRRSQTDWPTDRRSLYNFDFDIQSERFFENIIFAQLFKRKSSFHITRRPHAKFSSVRRWIRLLEDSDHSPHLRQFPLSFFSALELLLHLGLPSGPFSFPLLFS
jgi:hypothetical protein